VEPPPTCNHGAMPSTALLVIDVQEEYFSGALPIEAPPRDGSLARILEAMAAARAAGVPVVVVRHTEPPGEGSFDAGTAAWHLRPEIEAEPHDLFVDKTLPGTFTGTELGPWLEARGIEHITITGYMTNVCCDTTARQALHRGLGATLLQDATGVPDMPAVDGGVVAAADLQRATLAPLALMGVEVVTVDDWVGSLGADAT
jgi:nicotinamidase-related amidase